MKTIVVPLFFDESGSPKNPQLYSAVEGYVAGEFGERAPDLRKLGKAWAAVEWDGESIQVIGVGGAGYVLDIPLFHSNSEKGFLALFKRIQAWAEDAGAPTALVCVEPESLAKVKPYLELLKAEPSNRWKWKIGKLEA